MNTAEMTSNELMATYWAVAQEIDKREGDLKIDTYAAPHVWNLVAKTLRENYALLTILDKADFPEVFHKRRTIEDIALMFAFRFVQDAGFDPVKFLDQCSPDPENYPLSELWEESNASR